MDNFKVPSGAPTTNKCIRFPDDIIEQVEEEIRIAGTGCSFSSFIVAATELALKNLKEVREAEKNSTL